MQVKDGKWKELTRLAESAETIFVQIKIVNLDPKSGVARSSQLITKSKVSTHYSSTALLMCFS